MGEIRMNYRKTLFVFATVALSATYGFVQAAEGDDGQTRTVQRAAKVSAEVDKDVMPWSGKIVAGLDEYLDATPADQIVSVIVLLKDQADLSAITARMDGSYATLARRHETVVRSLQETAGATQGPLFTRIADLYLEGRIERFEPYWITNCIRMDTTKDLIREIASRLDVAQVYYNYPIELIEPTFVGPPLDPRSDRAVELGVQAVRAPEVWAMGFTGAGVLVSTLDTGVDGNHPALASRWRGLDPAYAGHPGWAFFDPVTNWTFPQDGASHGTHTMGSVCGGAPGNEVGVAPGAQWIHAAVIDRSGLMDTVTDAILAFQWLVDPDGNPATNWDVPAVNSNSWGIGTWHNVPPYNTPCDESFWSYLDACEAAGIVILFSAGNEGPSANSLRRPGDRATSDYRTCAVGGIDANNPPNWTMYNSSSRGPTYCGPGGSQAIKPEIAAPAVSVVSSVPGGGYSPMSGTSMASPHVNGVVALIREACPNLGVDEVKQVMYDTALDLGTPGKDNNYGYGLVDAYEAVLLALSLCSGEPRASDGYYEIAVETPALVAFEAIDYDGLPDPMTYIVISLPDPENTLTDTGNSHVIVPGDLPYALAGGGNEVLYTPGAGYYGTDSFEFKANDGGVPPDGGDSNLATISMMVLYGPPVITAQALPDGYLDLNYGPVQIETSGGQPELDWVLVTGGPYSETDLGSSLFAEVGAAQGWHANDSSWSYNLPFTFPFFGESYTSVWVCSNGYLDFASNFADWSNAALELISNVRIAPLWYDLRTDVDDDDVFIDESVSGQVTIRWGAHSNYSGGSLVNVSCTLYEDGRIRFHYGSGNSPITPTIGISAGDGIDYNLAAYDNAPSLPDANSLQFAVPTTLPVGLALSSDGVITGIPTESGEFEPSVRVTDSLGRSDQTEIPLVILAEDPDCNGNGTSDIEDIANCDGSPWCGDCNSNFIPDGCELDTDSDELIDVCDSDDDNDGVNDGTDPAPLDPDVCGDSDGDNCDDCAVGTDNFGPLPDNDPANDGVDLDVDGVCDASDNCALFNPDQLDCQPNGVGDVCDIDGGTSADCSSNGIPDDCEGLCAVDQDCDDGDTCTADACDCANPEAGSDGCLHISQPRPYGDITPFGALVPPCPADPQGELGDGFANMLDVNCAFAAFNEGLPFTVCPCGDVYPCEGGDGFVNMLDVFSIFNAFNDDPWCPDACP